MSYDLSLVTLCNHRITKELSYLEGDLRSIRVAQPMSSTTNVEVYASEDLVLESEYDIIVDPSSIAVHPPKMIYFKSNWRAPYDVFEVSYTTLNSTCPKCSGLGALHDIGFLNTGAVSMNKNERLLLQNLEKFIITELKSNPFHGYIGTGLVNLLGEKIQDMNYLKTKITQEIMASLDKFKELQKKYASSGRPLTDGETLETVNSVNTVQDTSDPTILRVSVEATAASGKPIDYVQLLKVA